MSPPSALKDPYKRRKVFLNQYNCLHRKKTILGETKAYSMKINSACNKIKENRKRKEGRKNEEGEWKK